MAISNVNSMNNIIEITVDLEIFLSIQLFLQILPNNMHFYFMCLFIFIVKSLINIFIYVHVCLILTVSRVKLFLFRVFCPYLKERFHKNISLSHFFLS